MGRIRVDVRGSGRGDRMSDYNEGDLVEAVKGEDHRIGRVTVPGTHQRMQGYCLHRYKEDGWTVTVIERAKPALPTAEGWYLDRQGDCWHLNASGSWYCPSSPSDDARPQVYVPFTRLEPVADTAKRVLAAIAARTVMHCDGCAGHVTDIAHEFGVTGGLGE